MVLLGVDIGGSRTRAVAVDAVGRTLAEVEVTTASLQAVGAAGAEAALDDLVTALGDLAGRVEVLAAGSAGVDTPESERRLADLLEARFPRATVRVVHDTRLLLAAARLRTGCVLIVGTGSAAWAIGADGVDARAGGWGWLLGDEGSAFGVVKAAVQQALSDWDQGREVSLLTRDLLVAVGVDRPVDLLTSFYTRQGSRHWASYAPVVVGAVRAGCPRARGVLDRSLDAAAAEVRLACSRVGITGPVVLAGGFVENVPEVADGLIARLADIGIIEVSVLRREPVLGAVELALAGGGASTVGGVDA